MARRRDAVDHEGVARRVEVARRLLEYAHRFGDESAVDIDAMTAAELRAYAERGLLKWQVELHGCAHAALANLNAVPDPNPRAAA